MFTDITFTELLKYSYLVAIDERYYTFMTCDGHKRKILKGSKDLDDIKSVNTAVIKGKLRGITGRINEVNFDPLVVFYRTYNKDTKVYKYTLYYKGKLIKDLGQQELIDIINSKDYNYHNVKGQSGKGILGIRWSLYTFIKGEEFIENNKVQYSMDVYLGDAVIAPYLGVRGIKSLVFQTNSYGMKYFMEHYSGSIIDIVKSSLCIKVYLDITNTGFNKLISDLSDSFKLNMYLAYLNRTGNKSKYEHGIIIRSFNLVSKKTFDTIVDKLNLMIDYSKIKYITKDGIDFYLGGRQNITIEGLLKMDEKVVERIKMSASKYGMSEYTFEKFMKAVMEKDFKIFYKDIEKELSEFDKAVVVNKKLHSSNFCYKLDATAINSLAWICSCIWR